MKRNSAVPQLQSGVSLIELMVSLTIGLIIMLAVVSVYLGSAGAGRTAEAIGRMNEDAQMALTILSQQLRMAGVNPSQPDRSSVTVGDGTTVTFINGKIATGSVTGTNTTLANGTAVTLATLASGATATGAINSRGNTMPLHNPVTNVFAIRGCDVKFSDVASALTTASLTCGHTASSTGANAISIAYEADRYNTIPTNSPNFKPTDCMGSSTLTSNTYTFQTSTGVTTPTTVFEAENRYYVGTSTSIVNPTLYCKGNGSANGQPLIENIEDLQFSYGTSNPLITPTTVIGYLSAYQVDTVTTPTYFISLSAGSPARWNAVKTVRICVVARSENPVLDTIESAKYMKCDGTLETNPPDKRLRRAYTTTVVLRNQ